MSKQWIAQAIRKLKENDQRSADTHLLKMHLPAFPNVDLYFKDESTHVTGSLKHRLAKSLFLLALANGDITKDTPIIEASSGSTAVSEAYFARILGLKFIAVMAKSTSKQKIERIKKYGGECVFVDDPSEDRDTAQKLAIESGGYFMDQFTFAERATDWRGNNNIAESIFAQMSCERFAIPSWVICGAGTGGTSTTIGRYINYKGYATKLCVVDPTISVLHDYYTTGNRATCCRGGSNIEGIGRPYVPASFNRNTIDRMLKVTNEQSYAAMHFLSDILEKKVGASSGTNLYGAFTIMSEMHKNNQSGSIVTLLCDSGQLYEETYYNDEWLKKNNYDISAELKKLYAFYNTAKW